MLDLHPTDAELKRVWSQTNIPVVLRRGGLGQRLRIRIPSSNKTFEWLRSGRRQHPRFIKNGAYWELPKAWFNDFVERALKKFGKLYVIQPYREQEICAPPASMRKDMNASARAWAPITVPVMTGAGLKLLKRLRAAGTISILHAG